MSKKHKNQWDITDEEQEESLEEFERFEKGEIDIESISSGKIPESIDKRSGLPTHIIKDISRTFGGESNNTKKDKHHKDKKKKSDDIKDIFFSKVDDESEDSEPIKVDPDDSVELTYKIKSTDFDTESDDKDKFLDEIYDSLGHIYMFTEYADKYNVISLEDGLISITHNLMDRVTGNNIVINKDYAINILRLFKCALIVTRTPLALYKAQEFNKKYLSFDGNISYNSDEFDLWYVSINDYIAVFLVDKDSFEDLDTLIKTVDNNPNALLFHYMSIVEKAFSESNSFQAYDEFYSNKENSKDIVDKIIKDYSKKSEDDANNSIIDYEDVINTALEAIDKIKSKLSGDFKKGEDNNGEEESRPDTDSKDNEESITEDSRLSEDGDDSEEDEESYDEDESEEEDVSEEEDEEEGEPVEVVSEEDNLSAALDEIEIEEEDRGAEEIKNNEIQKIKPIDSSKNDMIINVKHK